jgi:hypothetical protein
MVGEPQANQPSISSTQPLTVEYVPGILRMHTISEDRLDMLVSGYTSLHLTFFGITFGGAVSFGIVLFNGVTDPFHKMAYQLFLFGSLIMSAFFGVRGWGEVRQAQKKLKEIKGVKNSN